MADCMKLAEKELYTLLLESVGRAVAAGIAISEIFCMGLWDF